MRERERVREREREGGRERSREDKKGHRKIIIDGGPRIFNLIRCF